MNRPLAFVCMLASTLGVSATVSTGMAVAQSSTLDAPSAAVPAGASPSGPAKVGVIVFQQAVQQTNEGQRDFAQVNQKFEPKRAQLKALSDEVDSLKKQLQDAGSTLSDTERDSRLRTIDEKTKSLQRVAEDDQNDMTTAMNDVYQQLAQKVYAVMDTYAKQNNFTLVLDASASQSGPVVIWLNPSTDITRAVVAAYNAKSGVPAPAGPAAGTAPRSTTPSAPTRPSTTRTH